MTDSGSGDRIDARVEGDVSGQVAIGKYINQTTIHGGQVTILPAEQRPRAIPRSGPVVVRPKPFRTLLDRKAEVGTATSVISASRPLEFHGEPGIGKTVLLRVLAHDGSTDTFPDGVVYLRAAGLPLDDLLQLLFDEFHEYENGVRYKPTASELRQGFRGRRALILIDDLELSREEAETLMDAAPEATFVFASANRRVWGESLDVSLRGLPVEDAVALVEEELRRPLLPTERPMAQSLCERLEGHPLQIRQAVAPARVEGRTLAELEAQLGAGAPSEAAAQVAVESVPRERRGVIAALAVLVRAGLTGRDVGRITALPDAEQALGELEESGVLQRIGNRYALAGNVGSYVATHWDLEQWGGQLVVHFAARVEELRATPDELGAEAPLLVELVRWATKRNRWDDVLALVTKSEPTLALSRRWESWRTILDAGLHAARASGDRSAEAALLHQLGTRSLCLEETGEAISQLREALRIREAIGDSAGAAVTRHNLEIIGAAPPIDDREPPDDRRADDQPTDRVPDDGGALKHLPWRRIATVGAAAAIAGVTYVILSGDEAQSRELEFSPVSLHFTEQLIGAPSEAQTLRITNLGDASLRIGSLEIDAGDFGLAGETCTGEDPLVPGGSCVAEVFFLPSDAGARSANLTVRGPEGTPLRSVRITGAATQPDDPPPPGTAELALSTAELGFGSQRVGVRSDELTLTMASQGTADLVVQQVSVAGPAAADFAMTTDCSNRTAAPGESCSARVAFRPAVAGTRNATVRFTTNAGTRTVRLVGIGVTAALVVDPSRVDFDSTTVGVRSAQQLALHNSGSASLAIRGIRLGGQTPDVFSIRDGCSGRELGIGQSCEVQLVFAPPAPGDAQGELAIHHDAGPDPHVVILAGRGVRPAVATAELNTHEVDFGRRQVVAPGGPNVLETLVGSVVAPSVRITSTGTAPLQVGAVEIRGSHAADFSIVSDSCSRERVAPGARCSVRVNFAPRAVGTRNAELRITDNSTAGSHRVTLTGVGEERAAPLPDLHVVAFDTTGSPRLGEGSRQLEVPVRVTIRNSGNAEAEVFKVAVEREGRGVLTFTVPGQRDRRYPFTSRPLAAGQQVVFQGLVILVPSPPAGEPIHLRAVADSCAGDEFMPAHCRVEESNERNNTSDRLTTQLSLPPIN